ncbi:MAG: hypothetical protein P8Z00_14015 [Anaerolineales bacterium]
MLPNKRLAEKPLMRSEWLAAMLLFLLPPLIIPIMSYLSLTGANIPWWLDNFALLLLLVLLILALGFGIIKGLPRWSLSYLGFLLMTGIILALSDRLWGWIYPTFLQSFGARSLWSLAVRFLYQGVFAVIVLFSMLLSALILVTILRLLPYYANLWQRIRADWTQLSFLFYGGLVLGILFTFDEYHYDQVWLFLAWTSLAVGAWFYLRARQPRRRILALVGGVTAAMWIVALAKWVLIPLQAWPDGFPVAPSPATRWFETGSALIDWGLIVLMLCMPALLNLLPTSTDQFVQEGVGSA